jgi:hypothetical protein
VAAAICEKDLAMLQRFTAISSLKSLISVAFVLSPIAASAEATFARQPTQYIAALGDSAATSGTDAGDWGLWEIDPGPRGVWTRDFAALVAAGGIAPKGWQFDQQAWWLEEHGLIMEAPVFPLPEGQYVVTGGREVVSVLTVEASDVAGLQAWSLANGASIYDVTHLGCRAAVYTPAAGQSCSPEATPTQAFPMSPDKQMPAISGCEKADFQVLIVVGRMVEG